jgi:hypothetical protein
MSRLVRCTWDEGPTAVGGELARRVAELVGCSATCLGCSASSSRMHLPRITLMLLQELDDTDSGWMCRIDEQVRPVPDVCDRQVVAS